MDLLPKDGMKLHPSFCLLKEKLPPKHPKCYLLQGIHQLTYISPRHGGDVGCAVSQDTVASGVEALLAGSVAGPHAGGCAAG